MLGVELGTWVSCLQKGEEADFSLCSITSCPPKVLWGFSLKERAEINLIEKFKGKDCFFKRRNNILLMRVH